MQVRDYVQVFFLFATFFVISFICFSLGEMEATREHGLTSLRTKNKNRTSGYLRQLRSGRDLTESTQFSFEINHGSYDWIQNCLTFPFPMCQFGAFRPLRRDCARLRDRRMS